MQPWEHTSDSKRLVTVQSETAANLWTINSDWSTPTELTAGLERVDGRDGVVHTPDGELVYASRASGSLDLWTMKGDGDAILATFAHLKSSHKLNNADFINKSVAFITKHYSTLCGTEDLSNPR
jgi:hypothetical protein